MSIITPSVSNLLILLERPASEVMHELWRSRLPDMQLLAHSKRRVACTKSISQVQTLIHVVHHTVTWRSYSMLKHLMNSLNIARPWRIEADALVSRRLLSNC